MKNNPIVITGKFIKIYELNKFFSHVSSMMLEHFDTPRYANTVFLLGTYILESVAEIRKKFPGLRIIAYQLEQLMAGNNWHSVKTTMSNLEGADEIWDFDFLNSAFLAENGIKVNRLVPILHTSLLQRIDFKEDPFFDVLFYGYMNERRFKIFHDLQKSLYGNIKLNWIYGSCDIDKYIQDSKVILNLHAFEPYSRQEQVRMFYPIINYKTVISEASQLNNLSGSIIESSLEDLAGSIKCVCHSDIWREFGKQAETNFRLKTERFLANEESAEDVIISTK
jgi:hypothetical protein